MKSDILIDGSLFLADGNVDAQFVDLQYDSQLLRHKWDRSRSLSGLRSSPWAGVFVLLN